MGEEHSEASYHAEMSRPLRSRAERAKRKLAGQALRVAAQMAGEDFESGILAPPHRDCDLRGLGRGLEQLYFFKEPWVENSCGKESI